MQFGFERKSFDDEVIEFVGCKGLEAEEKGDKVNDTMMLDTLLCHHLNFKMFKLFVVLC